MFGPIKRKLKEKEDPAEKQREHEETARVYAEFVKSFQVEEDSKVKKFVRGGVIDPNKNFFDGAEESPSQDLPNTATKYSKKTLWVPSSEESLQTRQLLSRTSTTSPTGFSSTTQTTLRTELGKGIGGLDGLTEAKTQTTTGQRVREIDTFLEEIKRRQELIDQRKQLRQVEHEPGLDSMDFELLHSKIDLAETDYQGCFLSGSLEAEESTNLYLGNLSPEITEEFLCQQFGKYGHITSVKIMYPRSEEERARRRHCGFVSFENRDMADAARTALDGEEFYNMPIRIGWGKAVSRAPSSAGSTTLPLLTSTLPSSVSLVSCNTSQSLGFSDNPPKPSEKNFFIHVQIPEDPYQRFVIDIVSQYILKDGYPLEQLLLQKNMHNEYFHFLQDKQSKYADYYRWRVYSLAQGDTLKSWRLEPYQTFTQGQKWYPPCNTLESRKIEKRPSNFSSPLEGANADSLTDRRRDSMTSSGALVKGSRRLNKENREELENLLRHLTRERSSIQNAMAFCLDHSEYALEISECLMESLTIEKTPLDTKIARLYLVSDILYNLSSSQQPAWSYRSALQRYLPDIFAHHNRVLRGLTGKLTIESLKGRVMAVLRIWEDWALYPPLFTKGLEASFLKEDKLLQNVFSNAITPMGVEDSLYDKDVDGVILTDFSTLSKFSFWIRESVREWNSLDLSHLEALCFRRGLPISPEPTLNNFTSQETHPNIETEDAKKKKDSIPPIVSYGSMRQLLIKRLVEREAYWRNRQILNAKAFHISHHPPDLSIQP